MQLVIAVYKLTESFPQSEIYGLTAQMRRSAVSIPSNIAEGRRRTSKKDFRQFIHIAYGSASELETQLEISIALDLGQPTEQERVRQLLLEILKMLNSLSSKLQPTT